MREITEEEIEAARVKINPIKCPKCKDRRIFISREGIRMVCLEC